RLLRRGRHLLRLVAGLFDRADHIECLFGHVVALAVEYLAEALDRVFDLNILALEARELLADRERLREESLDAACTRNGELVVLAQFVEAENGDDVLQILITLQNTLDLLRRIVMLVADDLR